MIKTDLAESITRVLKNLSPENAEYTYNKDMTPLDKFFTSLVKVNKLNNREEVYENLKKMVVKKSSGAYEQYATDTMKDLNEDYNDSLGDLILAGIDYEHNESAYGRSVLMAEKVVGLMKLNGKQLYDFEDDGEVFQDKSIWNKLNGEDLANMPQFIREFSVVDDMIKDMDSRYMKNMLNLIEENDKHRDDIINTMILADIGAMFISMMKQMSEISSKASTLKSENVLEAVDEDDDDLEVDSDYWDKVESKLSSRLQTSIFSLKKKVANEVAEKVRDLLEDEIKDKFAENISMLIDGKPLALNKDKDQNIITAAYIVDHYIKGNLEQTAKVEITNMLLPLTYAMALTGEDRLSDIIDLDEIEDYISIKQDKSLDLDDIEDLVDDCELEEAVALDYSIGSNVATYYYGVDKDEEFIKLLARKTIPNISYEWAENRLAKNYNRSVNVNGIAEILGDDYKNFQDESVLIQSAASAIHSAITEE